MQSRFHVRADVLRIATEEQRTQVNRLLTAARFTGYLALFVVICMAVVGGSSGAAAIAPALLYIEFVVSGLERLPPWLREFRLAVTSKRRIEQITKTPPRVERGAASGQTNDSASRFVLRDVALTPDSPLSIGDVELPLGGVIVLAGDRGSSPDALAEVIAGDRDPDAGSVLLDGVDVRYPTVRRRITLIADEPYLMDATVREHLNSSGADLGDDDIAAVLERVGLGHLLMLDGGGVDAALGTHAEVLSVHERQRLMIAMTCLGDADVVVVQDLALFSDADAAEPLISALTQRRRRTIILSTMNEEVAAMADHVLAIVGRELMMGQHRDLMAHEDYVQVWQRHLPGVIDERILASFPEPQRERLRPRLFTEHYSPGDVLVRAGSRIDRVLYVVSGRVEIVGMNASGHELRVAEIGPGNFCGDISEAGGVNTQTIRAVEETTVRTLSAESWSAGLLGLLDADPAERRVLSSILRLDHPTRDELAALIDDFPTEQIGIAVDSLISLGQVRERPDGGLVVSVKRKTIRDSTGLLDRLADL
jgi:ABC-type multidrug transport system ATPase subunit